MIEEKQTEIIQRLELWQERIEKLEIQLDAFRFITGGFEGDFAESIYGVTEAYTDVVSELVGDQGEWLSWYMYECDMGRKPREVTFKNGKTLKVRTLRQLARVIRHD